MDKRSNNNEEQSNHPACAACKSQRKKCATSCILRRHFPANQQEGFAAVQKTFGVANVMKMMKEAESLDQQDEIAKSLYWEAGLWVHDPVGGPYRAFTRLQDEIRALREEINALTQHLLAPANMMASVNHNYHGNMNMMVISNSDRNVNSLVMESGYNYGHVNRNNGGAAAVGAVNQGRSLQEVEPRLVTQQGEIARFVPGSSVWQIHGIGRGNYGSRVSPKREHGPIGR